MLAVMKLGAVIMPTTTAVGPADLTDRIERAEARYVDRQPGRRGRSSTTSPATTRGSWSATDRDGWSDLRRRTPAERPSRTRARRPRTRCCCTSPPARRAGPKLVEHTQVSYPVGHLTTMYWIGLQPGDVHLNISSPGWAKHAWSCFFAPWIAEATVFVYNYARFDPAALLRSSRRAASTPSAPRRRCGGC